MVENAEEETKNQNETQIDGTNATSNFQEYSEERDKNTNSARNNGTPQRPVFRLNLENVSNQ